MQSFLIISKDKNKALEYVTDFLKKEGIDAIDANINSFEKAIGIEDVRNIQKKIFLKPFRGKVKAVILETYENITQEAQNALLKVLEEPPANTIIIISASKKEFLLPTIISRCKVIELTSSNLDLSKEEISEYLNVLISLSEKGVGYKLKLAQDIAANKEESTVWLEKMSIVVREKLIKDYKNSQYLRFLRLLQKTYTIIKSTNVNQRVALENLFLSL
ncbi:MAG: hypothetical protein HY424_00115 [Candidatus Levybacteria bacterium]|nr:hypothetical protein [Candidatus Levybacteria bacterium]